MCFFTESSVSKLLGFETFPILLMVSVSVSKIFGCEKSIAIGFEFFSRKKFFIYAMHYGECNAMLFGNLAKTLPTP